MALIPPHFLEGLTSVRLTLGRRAQRARANAAYYYEHHRIEIYPYPATLEYRLPQGYKVGPSRVGFTNELAFGMRLEERGSRVVCSWAAPDLERFVLHHVLLHEIGHHVYHTTRWRQGYIHKPRTVESEQYAEAFGCRLRRELFPERQIGGS